MREDETLKKEELFPAEKMEELETESLYEQKAAGQQENTDGGTRDLILIALSESAGCPQVIRAAVRLAKDLNAPMKAVYVEHIRPEALGEHERQNLEANIKLAKALGAGVVFGYGTDIAGQILETANVTGATKLFIGLPGRALFFRQENIAVQIKKRMPSLDIYIIPGSAANIKPGKLDVNAVVKSKTYRNTPPFKMFLSLVGVLSLCTLIALTAWYFGIPYVDIVIIYLFGVLILSMIDGNLIFIAASSFSAVMLVNYFFVEPLYCFDYNKSTDLTTFIMMFIMAFTISFLMGRFRKELESNHKNAMRTDILFDCSTLLLLAKTEADIEETIAEQFIRLLRMSIVIYKKADGAGSCAEKSDGINRENNAENGIKNSAENRNENVTGFKAANGKKGMGDEENQELRKFKLQYFPKPGVSVSQLYPVDNETDRRAVRTVFETGMMAGFGTKRDNGARAVYLPIKYGEQVFAAVGMFRTDGRDIPSFEFGILNSILSEAGLVYSRIREEEEKINA